MKLHHFLGIALSICLFNQSAYSAKPADAAPTIASSSSSLRDLPPLTALQQEKLTEFKASEGASNKPLKASHILKNIKLI
ncbi:MAG: hypothetical protein P4L31_04600 [Candidatus Babeliales bacterium]|nr:hypothetical protein [Candidatus Babeliales bacterium]